MAERRALDVEEGTVGEHPDVPVRDDVRDGCAPVLGIATGDGERVEAQGQPSSESGFGRTGIESALEAGDAPVEREHG